MLKATRYCAVLLGLLALGLFVAEAPVFAEVQHVKVGGDVTVRAFHRENLDLRSEDDTNATQLDRDAFIQQTTALNVGADLTENASANLRITNERDWNETGNAAGDFDVSHAYLTLKELFYTPLSVRVGTQPIVWGRGFILGSALLPTVVNSNDRNASITANEFTDFTAFDAMRATLDLSGAAAVDLPITIDAVYIKLDENVVDTPDDVNLLGVNIGTRLDAANSEVEAYFLNKRDKNTDAVSLTGVNNEGENDGSLNTIGVRGSAQPVEGASVWGELAYQFGRRVTDPNLQQIPGDSAQAWAANLGVDYTLADVAMTPKFGAEWRFYTGKDLNGAVAGWSAIAPGYFTTALREFQTGNGVGGFYANDQTCVATAANTATAGPCTGGSSNQHELALVAGLKPIEDLTISNRLAWFVSAVGQIPVAGGKRESFIGTEWDTVATYNYTDDVQLGVIYGLFLPGSVFRTPNDSTAQELVSTVSVKF